MMVVLATTANVSVGRAFLGGIAPGLMMAVGIMGACYLFAKRGGPAYAETEPFSVARLWRTFVAALPAFLLPLIIVGGIIGGAVTPTEAAAVAVFFGLVISLFVYREIGVGDIPKMILRAASVSASIMMIIATASVFSWLIAVENAPATIAGMMHQATDSPLGFLLFVNILLLLIGMIMEGISAILVMVPVLLPIALSYGIDPLHFGVIVILNLSIGMITPPYGITLYVASSVADRTVIQVSRKIGMPLLLMILVLVLTTVFPSIVTTIPDFFMGEAS